MSHLQNKHTGSGGYGRFLKLTLLTILILVITTLATGSSQPAAAQGPLGPAWVFQGPAPQINAQQDLANVAQPDEPVSGAITAIAASPTDPDLVYVGAANGGVWKTTNATDANPTWTPLTDQLRSLSIGVDALDLDPLDNTGQTVIAGTGRFSGYANRGDDLAGIYYTTDGGANWVTSTSPLLSAARITGVAARGSTLLVASENGLFRSTTGPLGTWSQISGSGGLPNVRAADIEADPNDTNVLYVTFTGAGGGLFRTDDLGATWTNITGNINVISSDTTAFEVAVYNDGITNVVTVELNGTVNGAVGYAILRSVNGAAFTALDVPFVFKDAYGKFGLTADKTNPDLVYVSGGYALTGGSPFLATTTRVDASQPSGSQLTLLYDAVSTDIIVAMNTTTTYAYVRSSTVLPTTYPFDIIIDGEQVTVTSIYGNYGWYSIFRVVRGANGTTVAAHDKYALVFPLNSTYGAPHVDINNLAIDANGGLLMGAHGGIFYLPEPDNPSAAANTWLSKNGNLGVSEMHDVAYDHVTKTLIGSNQDNCVVIQSAPGNLTWPVGPGFAGDGGDVAVADMGNGQSVRYGSNQNLGPFTRLVYDASNNLVSATTLSTSVIPDKQFTTPIAVNAVDPHRLLIGGSANLYESLNMGDAINKIATVGVSDRAIAYGGSRNDVANPDVLYVSSGGNTFYTRTAAGGAVVAKPFPAGGAWYARDIVLNPEDWMNVFVVDKDSVFASIDGGDTWSEITGNLLSVSSTEFMTIEFVEAPSPYIVVGTRSGVFASYVDALGSWFELGTDLPDVLVFELDYDAVDDVLAAATLGRGAWLLPDASTAVAPVGVPPVLALSGDATVDEGSTHTYTFTVDDPGDLFTVDSLTVGAGGELVSDSLVTTATGGSFQVTFPDGPASSSVSLQVLDSTGELSNLETIAVTVSNVAPTAAILGAPTSGSPGTTVNLSSLVTDPSPADTTAGFTYYWLIQKYVDGVFVGNFATGDMADFSYTPDVVGKYNVFFHAQDKDGVWSSWAFKTIYAASPDLTADTFVVTVPEGATAANLGTFQNVNGNPLTLSASVGTLTRIDDSPTPITVQGYWKLGEDDPGAADGLTGNNPTLGRDGSGLNPALNLTRSGSPTYLSLGTSASVIFDSFGSAAALAGPTIDTIFTTSQPWVITRIFNWHQNGSFPSGQDPTTVDGTISILDYPSGTVRGTWTAAGANSNLAWEILPDIVLPAGSYQIVESQTGPSSWSYTTTGGVADWEAYKGMSQVSAAPITPGTDSVLAMSFDGSSGYVRSSPVPTTGNNFGIEAWVKPTGTSSDFQVIAYNGNTSGTGFGLAIGPNGNFYGYYAGNSLQGKMDTGIAATPDVWSHIALVRDNSINKIYVNGTLVYTSSVLMNRTPTVSFTVGFGRNSTLGDTNYLNGSVDDVRVFTFDPGTFDPRTLNYPSGISGDWSWSYTPDDGPAQSQDVTIMATDGVNAEVTNLPFSLVIENVAPTATFGNLGAVNEGSTGRVAFASWSDPSMTDTAAGFHYAFDFDNDGVFEIGDGTYAGSGSTARPTVPASFLADGPGTRTVHGRILDKDGGYTDYTTTITINNTTPSTSVSGPADALVGQLVGFLLAGDDSPADQAAGFTYSINWGDGSPLETVDPVVGTGDAVVRHAYATSGSYTVQVTATDKDGATSTAASTTVSVSDMNTANLQSLIATAPFVELAPADDAAFQNEIAAINGLADLGTPVAITIILGNGPYGPVTLSAPDSIILDLAGNDTKDSEGTQIISSSGPAVTVAAGEVYVQGDHLATSADAPTVLVTGGHLTLDQVNIQESTGFNNVAVRVAGGSVNLGFDVIMNVNGDGGFVDSYARSALVPHPEGIDAELTPNTFQVTQYADDGTLIQATIQAVSLSSTDLSSSAATTTFGESVTFTAVVDVKAIEHGPATGTVRFYDGEVLLGDGVVNYVGGEFVANFATDGLGVGEHVMTAVYGGDNAYVASSASLTHEVLAVSEPEADLSVTKTANADPTKVETLLTYTIVVTNNGPNLATGVVLTDTLPEDVEFTSVTTSQGSCAEEDEDVSCDLGDLANGVAATVTIQVVPEEAGEITNVVTVVGNEIDPDQNNNTALVTTAIIAANRCAGMEATIVGSNRNDVLVGTNRDDVIVGLGGHDIIYGRGGNDIICSGSGDDMISGGNGNDVLKGGRDWDILLGEGGDDELHGGRGSDILNGGNGKDLLFGGKDADLLLGQNGDDILAGWEGADDLFGGSGADALDGGSGSDYCHGGSGTDTAVTCETELGIP